MEYDHYTKSELIDMLVTLEREFEHLKRVMEDYPSSADLMAPRQKDPYALFEPFVDEPQNCLVLINMSYRICYINPACTELLQIQSPESVTDRNVFDLMKLKYALKLKESIDQTYVSGKKRKLKDLRFIKPDGSSVKVKVRTWRVRFDEKPAVQMILKPN